MKKSILLCFLGLATICYTIAQNSPQAFKYQAVARDINGNEIKNKAINFRLSLLQGSTVGVSVYTETHSITTNDFGVANITVGDGTVVSGVFANINWGANSHFLKVEMDANGGTNYQLMGTSQLLSVPYALFAGQTNSTKLKTGGGIGKTGDSIYSTLPVANQYQAGTGISITGTAPNFTISSTITGGGNTFSDTFWRYSSAGRAFTYGNIGINRLPNTRKLDILGNTSDATPNVVRVRAIPSTTSASLTQSGLSAFVSGGSGSYFNHALYGSITATNTGSQGFNTGVYGYSDSGELVSRGISGLAVGKTGGNNQGVFGRADGVNNSSNNTGVFGYSLNSSVSNIGVMGQADQSTAGNNFGVYGRASNGSVSTAGYFEGDVTYTGNLTGPSDAKLKENVQPFSNALTLLNSLQPKTYQFIQTGVYGKIGLPKGLQYGLIAQDVEVLFPNLVKNSVGFIQSPNVSAVEGSALDTTQSKLPQKYEFKSINYTGLIPVMIQAIKEQQAQIELLQQQNELLLKQLAELRR